jgi:hypothetical protein
MPRNQGPGQESPAVATHADIAKAPGTTGVPWLSKAKEIRKQGSPHRLETLFRGVKTRYVVENKGLAFGKAKQIPDMCMKTKEMIAQSRYVLEKKSS